MNHDMVQPAAQPPSQPRSRSRTWRVPAVLVPVAALLALSTLTACGEDSGSDTAVASVSDSGSPSSGTERAKKTADPDAGRPQLRLDTSEEEKMRLFNVWSSCIEAHGVPMQKVVKDGRHVPDNSDPGFPAAQKACIAKLPLDPPELDRAKNPHYLDDFRAQIACLHKAGVMVEAMSDGEGYSYPSGEIDVPNLQELEKHCLIEAFTDTDKDKDKDK
ncbi:hypothetical protein ACLVWQ_36870 [Streptomyces sp. CWNU-52B]|uniref:hypothetical protein n=1 Tax=unclassified Streptomyces TaxID=2593676 RepID=UPI0039BF3CAF